MSLITSAEHAYAIAIADIKKAAKVIQLGVLPTLEKLHADAPLIEGITQVVSPQAANIERVGDALLGTAIKALEDASTAAGSGGLNITLDAALVSDIRSIIAAVKSQAAPLVAAIPTK